jgi:Holliday junction resolvasome RuvABC endonuclease subunit
MNDMGYAFSDKGKLLYSGVKVIEKKRFPSEILKAGREAVFRLINDLDPDILAVEKTFVSNNRSSSLLNVFFDEIRAIGKRKNSVF